MRGCWRWGRDCWRLWRRLRSSTASRLCRTGALRGLGETRAPMLANLVGYWVLGLPLGFFLCFGLKWGIYGLWIGLTLALVVIALALHCALEKRCGEAAFSCQLLAFSFVRVSVSGIRGSCWSQARRADERTVLMARQACRH